MERWNVPGHIDQGHVVYTKYVCVPRLGDKKYLSQCPGNTVVQPKLRGRSRGDKHYGVKGPRRQQ